MSSSPDQLLDELMKLLNYDKLTCRQLKIGLFESRLKIKTLSEGLVADFESLKLHSEHQESFIEDQGTIISQLNREIITLKKNVDQKEEIIKDQGEIIVHKERVIEASGVSQIATDLEVGNLKAVVKKKDSEIEKMRNLLDDKDEIIYHYYKQT